MKTCVLIGPRASGKSSFLRSLMCSTANIHSTQSVDDVHLSDWVLRDIPGFNTELLLGADLVLLFVCCFGNIRSCYESVRLKYSGNLCIILTHSDDYSAFSCSIAFSKASSSVGFFDSVPIFLCNCLKSSNSQSIWQFCIN